MNEETFRLSRRNALAMFGAGGLAAAAAAVGHEVAWGGDKYPVIPYTLTSGAMEKFAITERLHVSIDGLGDEVVSLAGYAVFRRYSAILAPEAASIGAKLSWLTAETHVDFLKLKATGTSGLFGDVSARLSREDSNHAVVRPNALTLGSMQSSSSFAAALAGSSKSSPAYTAGQKCANMMSPKILLGALNEEFHLGGEFVELASQVSTIPPVGDVARTSSSKTLFDSAGKAVGTLIGADIEIGKILERVVLDDQQDVFDASIL